MPNILLTTSLILSLSLLSLSSYAQDYVFSWPFIESESMQPRGGNSQGPDVQLDNEISDDFQRIQESGLSKLERDRRAILAMAGPYRVSFDFLEIAGFQANFSPSAPYQSWGTEYVYVIANEPEFVSLQHLLVMTVIDDEGQTHGPFVTKHWRQDWQYQQESVHSYQGLNQWHKQSIDKHQQEGSWVQTVWQVDDSPRYAGWGTWEHRPSYSAWTSNETWRPLPRREYSVREDYDILVGQNTHTIIPDGWIHEEQNNKVVLESLGHEKQRIAREYGVARYQRIQNYDFSPSDAYIEATAKFWNLVRDYWAQLYAENETIELRAAVDQSGMFMPLFQRAQEIADGKEYEAEVEGKFVKETIDSFFK